MSTESFDPYHRWLGIAPKHQPPDHYRLLGIERFESDPEVIRDGADRQMVHVRSYQLGEYSALSQKVLNELATARVCLLNADRKAAYDAKLRECLAGEAVPEIPAEKTLPTDLGLRQAAEALPVLQEDTPSLRTRRSSPSPVLLAVGAVAAVVLFGALVWLITDGAPVETEAPEVAAADLDEPVAPPPPPPEPRPRLPEPDDRTERAPPGPIATELPETPEPPESRLTGATPPPAVAPFDAEEARQHQGRAVPASRRS